MCYTHIHTYVRTYICMYVCMLLPMWLLPVQVVKRYNKYEKERQELIRGVFVPGYFVFLFTGVLLHLCSMLHSRVCSHRADPPQEAKGHALCELKHCIVVATASRAVGVL